MSYTLIKGSFHIHYPATPLNGPEPDGDTLKFQPDHRELILALPKPNRPASFNRDGITSIRFEGIDALETHFDVGGDEYHQNLALALASRDALLAAAGFGAVTFFVDHPFKVQTVEHHPIPGYILSNGLDTYGRTIAFAFAGPHAAEDGTQIFVTPAMLDASLNAFMLRDGNAYPAFYLTLPAELRVHLRALVIAARGAGRGLWPQATATTEREATIAGIDELQQLVIWPKLFRRLAPYFQEGHADFGALDAWLRLDPRNRDDRLLLPNLELGNMHDLIVESGDRIRLAWAPEDIVIVPDDYVIETPAEPPSHAGRGDVRIVGALVNPAGEDRGNESVTLLNTTAAPVDFTGWKIADGHGRQALSGLLAAGDALRVRLGSNVQLNNTRDTISVLDATDTIVDQVSYEARELPAQGRTLLF